MDGVSIVQEALEHVSVGLVVLVYDKVFYANRTAQVLISDFGEKVLLEKINEIHGNPDVKKQELRLIDNNGDDRYILVEVCQEGPITALVMDITKEKEFSFVDDLTGIGNRHKYEHIISDVDFKNTVPMSALMCDINGLKLANDLFGHETGDSLIKAVACVLRDSIRSRGDILCRLGGDEFIIILPGANARAAQAVCDRVVTGCNSCNTLIIPPSLTIDFATRIDLTESIPELVKRADEAMLERKTRECSMKRHEMFDLLRKKLAEFSTETLEHSDRLKRIIHSFCSYLHLKNSERAILENLALFHDIGMARLPVVFLQKKGIYTDQDRLTMMAHVEAGYAAVKSVPEYMDLAIPIWHHHENWDGSGYPIGLHGEDIDGLARILHVADSYEVMTSTRNYRKAKNDTEAIEDLRRGKGKKYDPLIVEHFIAMLKSENESRNW